MLLAVVTILVYARLHFVPSGASNRLVEYCIAIVASVFPLGGLFSSFRAVRWLLLASWPRECGILAREESLLLRLGPFGVHGYDIARTEIRYPFELADGADASYEAYLPEEEQMERFLPRMIHPQAAEPLNRVILRFVRGSEMETAAALRPMIERWRGGART